MGTNSGVVTFSTATGQANETISNQNILARTTVYAIIEDESKKLWFGTSNGLYSYDGNVFRHIMMPQKLNTKSIKALAVGKSGTLWLGTNKGLLLFKNENFSSYTIYSTQNNLLGNQICALLYDSRHRMWVGTNKGLNCFKDGRWRSYTKQEGLIDDSVYAITEDRNRNIWIGTWSGVSLLPDGQKEMVNFNTKNGLPNNIIYSISSDQEGNVWFGTHGGASCLTSWNVKTFTATDGLPNGMIFSVIQDKEGGYWFGTSEGLCWYKKGRFKNYTTQDGLISNAISYLLEDRWGRIWIVTSKGLSIFSAGSFVNYTEKNGLPSIVLFDLVESKDGTIWMASMGGIIRCNNEKPFTPTFKLEPNVLFTVYSIHEDARGNLWLSSPNSLYRYSKKHLTNLSPFFGQPDNVIVVKTVFEDSTGKIWVGTDDGVGCFYKGKFNHYSTINSALPSNACNCILEDLQGNIWIGHDKGLSCFNGKEFRTYSFERMELTKRVWLRGIKDNQGNFWFGSTEGVTTFSPPPLKPSQVPPPVYINGLKVMEKDAPLLGKQSFQYNQNIFRFNFVGISFLTATGVSYKYQMENIDKEWRVTRDHSLFYPFLPPGAYTLRVKAMNADGIESTNPAEYSFVIRPPFWKTWWFFIITLLATSGVLLIGFRRHITRVRERAELRERNKQLVTSQRMELMGTLAAGTVHDLKNLMAVIIGYSRLMSKKYHGDQETYQDIEIIKNTASTAVQMAKQILSFARPKSQTNEPVELGMVLTEILDTLKVSQPRNIEILYEPPPHPVHLAIHPARLQQLVMNLCLNAFDAMSDGGKLLISLTCPADNGILLRVSDTGQAGIKKEHLKKIFQPMFTTKEQDKGTGLGLFVVKQIVDEYKGNIEVESEQGKGTTFLIRFPAI